MSLHLARALLALPILGAVVTAPDALAATSRWHDLSYTPTLNDGLALTGASFDGQKVLGSVALSYFELDGKRYELTESARVSGPTLAETDGSFTVLATWRVPVDGGEVNVTLYHSLIDADARYADLGEVSSWVRFDGPEGNYAFYWRIDPELRGAAGDRVQVFQNGRARGYWSAPATEQAIRLDGPGEFDRFKVRFSDGPDFVQQTQLRLAAPTTGEATAWLVRARGGEWDVDPASLVNGERLQRLEVGEALAQPLEGSDLALWYRASIQGSAGTVGPSLYVAEINARNAVIEIDRMQTTEYPPTSVVHRGETQSLATAFATGGITITREYRDGVMADKNRVNMSELDAIMEANVTYQATQDTPTQWYSWMGIGKTLDIPGVLGVMYDTEGYSSDNVWREGAFALYDSIVDTVPKLEDAGYPPQSLDQYLLWTVAHETGHAYNQHHEDYWIVDTSCFYEDTAIMGYSYDVANHLFWDFGPNSGSSMANEPEEYVRPGHGVDFIGDNPLYPYSTTRAHRNGHNKTKQFQGGGCE